MDIQGNFKEIKRQLAHERLRSDLCLHESRTGISREHQPMFNVLAQNARYVETAFKKLSTVAYRPIQVDDLEDVFAILLAQMRYLQDEYAVLVVSSSSDKDTAKLFRHFRKNTSGLTDEAIEDFRRAALGR